MKNWPPFMLRRFGFVCCSGHLQEPAAAFLAETVAVVPDGDHVAVVEQAVEEPARLLLLV